MIYFEKKTSYTYNITRGERLAPIHKNIIKLGQLTMYKNPSAVILSPDLLTEILNKKIARNIKDSVAYFAKQDIFRQCFRDCIYIYRYMIPTPSLLHLKV